MSARTQPPQPCAIACLRTAIASRGLVAGWGGCVVRLLGFLWTLGLTAWTAPWDPTEAGYSLVLESDATTALHETVVPLRLPHSVDFDQVVLTFGFGTMEPANAGGFLDALTLSLQPGYPAVPATIATSDPQGTAWFPPEPGATALPTNTVARTALPFPSEWSQGWAWQTAFQLTLTVPDAFRGCCLNLFVDLFDNGDDVVSAGYLRGARLVPTASYFLLESSASPGGPYAVEEGVTHDAGAHRFALPRGGANRFFRLRSDSAVTLRVLPPTVDEWRFSYDFPQPDPRLEASPRVGAAFVVQTNAHLNPEQRTFRLPLEAFQRFFRVRAGVRALITDVTLEAEELVVRFEYRPATFRLQSSAQACGPFADDGQAEFDLAAQTIRVSRKEAVRFFRVVHSPRDAQVRLWPVRDEHDQWQVDYDLVEAPAIQSVPGLGAGSGGLQP